MRVIGVIDLLGGRAVHARAGARDRYAPVRTVAGSPVFPGDSQALARAYIDRFGLAELYVADLDAIAARAPQEPATRALAGLGVPLWLDAGVTSVDDARRAIGAGAAQVIVGLETLSSYGALEDICEAIGGRRVAFSLDLRDGSPIVARDGISPAGGAHAIAARAVSAGAGAVIVIDLARVGTRAGVDLELIGRVRASAPHVTLLAGGGVRGPDDLARLAACGCDGALVATALQDGRVTAADLAAAVGYGAGSTL